MASAGLSYSYNRFTLHAVFNFDLFVVQEKQKGRARLVPRLLGVTKDSVLRYPIVPHISRLLNDRSLTRCICRSITS